MKLTELTIGPEIFTPNEVKGTVRFKCEKGEMLIYLSPQDILDVEALLLHKTKELGGEA